MPSCFAYRFIYLNTPTNLSDPLSNSTLHLSYNNQTVSQKGQGLPEYFAVSPYNVPIASVLYISTPPTNLSPVI
jgi:hypothetical protein